MAQEKRTYQTKLVENHANLTKIQSEISDFSAIRKLANGNKDIEAKLDNMSKRYASDLDYLQKREAYFFGKILETSDATRNQMLGVMFGTHKIVEVEK